MIETALLDVRVLPWRPRRRVMDPDTLREVASQPGGFFDDVEGLVVGLVMWLLIMVAAPLIVLVLALALLSVELPVVVALAAVLVLVRFSGLLPWTVVILDTVTGTERRESYRAIWNAVRRIRQVNHDRRVNVRWAWA